MSTGKHTIYDIAAEAGVSIATVSRVLRGEASVTEKTRKKVESVILRLNYQPSAIARGLTLRHSKTFGIVLPKVDNPHYALFFKGAYAEAMNAGYAMSLFPWEAMRSASQNLSEILAERRLDGVIICLEYINDDDLREQQSVLEAVRQYMPVVLIGCYAPFEQYPSVTINLSDCVRTAVEHLSNMGHERIALVGGYPETETRNTRDTGYREALTAARLPYIADYRVFCKCTSEDGEACMNDMLAGLKPSQWPTAVIAANDMVAIGCIRAIESHGRSVPADISVIGCDNLFFGPYMRPALTSIDTKQDYIGRRAVNMLLEDNVAAETVPCELICRESCAKVCH